MNIKNAINKINELVKSGMELKEAIVEVSWEFGIVKSELWAEIENK